MKYIMFTVSTGLITRKVPIIFPDNFVHKLVADVMRDCIKKHFPDNDRVRIKATSAGEYGSISHQCFGESKTLKLKSDPNDTDIIDNYDYLHGIV